MPSEQAIAATRTLTLLSRACPSAVGSRSPSEPTRALQEHSRRHHQLLAASRESPPLTSPSSTSSTSSTPSTPSTPSTDHAHNNTR